MDTRMLLIIALGLKNVDLNTINLREERTRGIGPRCLAAVCRRYKAGRWTTKARMKTEQLCLSICRITE